uniref:Uncharacterized protein n=1 Tax=Arundo donax TaxID=35708 RepID=A0A0A9FUZ4_ARUDO
MNNMGFMVAEFCYHRKRIKFSKEIFQQVLGIPSGDEPVMLESDDPSVLDAVSNLRKKYIVNKKAKINQVESLLKKEEDEVTFMQTFMFIAIQSILNPLTSNTINLHYLYSLVDVKKIPHIDWLHTFWKVLLMK